MSIYDQPSCGSRFADSNAYDDMSLVTGNSNQRDDALYQEDNVYLDDEWNLQSTLLRNPTVVLRFRSTVEREPPVSRLPVQYTTATVPENGSAVSFQPVLCYAQPGGGLMLSSNTWLVYKNARSGNGLGDRCEEPGWLHKCVASPHRCLPASVPQRRPQ